MPLYLSEDLTQSGASIRHTFIQFGGRPDLPRRRTQSVPPPARVHERDRSVLDISELPGDDGLSISELDAVTSASDIYCIESDGEGSMECEFSTGEFYTMKNKPSSWPRPTSAGTQCSESTASGNSVHKKDVALQRPRSRPSSAGTWSSGSQVAEMACDPDTQLATHAMTAELSEQVAEVINREFAYLRMSCHQLQPGKAHPRTGSTPVTLYFYVNGLPWAKRSKWRHPLLWTFSALLEKNGIPTSMRSGQLQAWPDQPCQIQVDVAAAREARDF